MVNVPEIVKILRRQEHLKKNEEEFQGSSSSTDYVSHRPLVLNDDFNEQKTIEEFSKDSKKTLHVLINLIPDPIVIVNKKGKFIAISDKIESITGFKEEELLGKNFLKTKIVTAKSKAILIKNLAKRMLGEKITSYEIDVISKDGKILPFEVSGHKIEYDGKSADLVVFHDLHKQREMEKELECQKKYFEVLFNNISYGIVTLQLDHKVKDVNPGFTQISGYTREELKGEDLPDFIIPSEEISKIKQHQEGGTFPIETTCKRKDGRLVSVEILNAPILAGSKKIGEYAIYKNITDQKRTKDELIKRINELELFNEVVVDRELKMIKLKKEVNELCEKYGEKFRYEVD